MHCFMNIVLKTEVLQSQLKKRQNKAKQWKKIVTKTFNVADIYSKT